MKKLMLVALLAGCASQPTESQVAAWMATYGPVCEKAGFVRPSEPWKQCIVGMIQREQRQTSFANALGQGLSAAGGTLNPQVYQNNYGGQAPVYTRCKTNFLGTTCETTPY